MRLTRFEPWRIASALNQDLARQANSRWQPAVDIVEYDDAYILRADLPGLDSSDIDINTDKGVLTISGERQALSTDENAQLTRNERASGKFERRFTLPESSDIDQIRAQSRNGILEVRIPKQPEVQARRITVEAA